MTDLPEVIEDHLAAPGSRGSDAAISDPPPTHTRHPRPSSTGDRRVACDRASILQWAEVFEPRYRIAHHQGDRHGLVLEDRSRLLPCHRGTER